MHEAGYRQILDIPGRTTSLARVRRLWVIDDEGLNHCRADRFRRLRARLRKNTGGASPASPYVYIRRGATGEPRRLVNETAVEEALSGVGFDIIDPMQMTPAAIAERLVKTRVAISVEGSQRNHALLAMPSGGAVINIQPPECLYHERKYFGDMAGIRVGFVVADQHHEGFTLEPGRLLRTLDLVVAEISCTSAAHASPSACKYCDRHSKNDDRAP